MSESVILAGIAAVLALISPRGSAKLPAIAIALAGPLVHSAFSH